MAAHVRCNIRHLLPEDWDMSEAEKLSGSRKPGRPVIESQDENSLQSVLDEMRPIR